MVFVARNRFWDRYLHTERLWESLWETAFLREWMKQTWAEREAEHASRAAKALVGSARSPQAVKAVGKLRSCSSGARPWSPHIPQALASPEGVRHLPFLGRPELSAGFRPCSRPWGSESFGPKGESGWLNTVSTVQCPRLPPCRDDIWHKSEQSKKTKAWRKNFPGREMYNPKSLRETESCWDQGVTGRPRGCGAASKTQGRARIVTDARSHHADLVFYFECNGSPLSVII